MFYLTRIFDKIKLPPSDLADSFRDAVIRRLNLKFQNKIIENVGLAVLVFDLVDIHDPVINPTDGFTFVEVFRPFMGEVIEGVVRSSTESGVHVTLGFFDDILIPPQMLQSNTLFDTKEQSWVWKFDENELLIEKGEKIRFRVISEDFKDVNPTEFKKKDPNNQEKEHSIQPYSIMGSIAEDGLGLVSWWAPSEEMIEEE